MKRVRRLFTFALALVMTFAVSAIAFADGEGSITVTNPKTPAGEETTTYELYRIFDVAAAKDKDNNYIMDGTGTEYKSMTYTINEDWEGFFTAGAAGEGYIVDTNDTSANGGKGYTPIVIDNAVKYIKLTDSNVQTFAKAAFTYSQENKLTPDKTSSTAEITGLDLGYYMIYPKGANVNMGDFTSIVSLTTTKPNATINQKAEYPTLEKTDDDESVQVGQQVTYTLTSKVPDTTGFNTFVFTMHDQMTAGLTFDGESSIKVTIENGDNDVDVPATGNKAYTYAAETPSNDGFTTAFGITIPVMEYQRYVGKDITVTYTATVNDAAVTKIDKNHATLQYSNNPKNGQQTTTTPPDEETVFSAKIVINKFDGSNPNAKLPGAKFILRCESVADASNDNAVAKAVVGKYYKFTPASGSTLAKVEWVEEAAVNTKMNANAAVAESDITPNGATVVTTGQDGTVSFDGLENGTYELIEVAAPSGYNQITGVATEVVVNGAVSADGTGANLEATADVANNAGSVLPSTGGIGTTIFYVVGGVMVAGAVIFLLTKRRMAGNE